jgi:hypothetical protein
VDRWIFIGFRASQTKPEKLPTLSQDCAEHALIMRALACSTALRPGHPSSLDEVREDIAAHWPTEGFDLFSVWQSHCSFALTRCQDHEGFILSSRQGKDLLRTGSIVAPDSIHLIDVSILVDHHSLMLLVALPVFALVCNFQEVLVIGQGIFNIKRPALPGDLRFFSGYHLCKLRPFIV